MEIGKSKIERRLNAEFVRTLGTLRGIRRMNAETQRRGEKGRNGIREDGVLGCGGYHCAGMRRVVASFASGFFGH
jgi:hypothetical protein